MGCTLLVLKEFQVFKKAQYQKELHGGQETSEGRRRLRSDLNGVIIGKEACREEG